MSAVVVAPLEGIVVSTSTIAVALSNVSSGGRAVGRHCGVHIDNCSGTVECQQWWSRRWKALWRPQTTANQLNHAVVLTPHTSEKH